MCFSASASFGASVVLGTVGVITLKKVKAPQQIPFAAIPLMFAAQQLSEGMLWMGLSDPAYAAWRHFSVYIFIIFAQLVWPSWVPFSLLLLERDRVRKKVLTFLLIMGLAVSCYVLYCLFVYDVSAEIRFSHIHYSLNFPMAFTWISSVLYFLPTVASLFVSGVRKMIFLGVAILLSFLVTKIFMQDFFISVWCFFAAGLSLIVWWIVSRFSKREANPEPSHL